MIDLENILGLTPKLSQTLLTPCALCLCGKSFSRRQRKSYIHPLTYFRQNVKQFIERTKATKSPLIQNAISFQETQKRMEQAEKEVRKLKLEALQRDINLGAEQLRNGQYTEYNDESLPGLLQKIKKRGERRLHSQKD